MELNLNVVMSGSVLSWCNGVVCRWDRILTKLLSSVCKCFIRLTRTAILNYSKTIRKHTVYRRFGFTSEAFIRTDFRCRSSVCKSLSHTWLSCSPSEGEQLRAQVVGALNQAKPPKSNISKGERQALRTLAEEKSVMILPADKGKATVIMDTAEYEKKVKEMLQWRKGVQRAEKRPHCRL